MSDNRPMRHPTDETPASPPGVGDPAPMLALPTLTGETFDLADARGQPVLVCFLRHAG